MSLGPGWYADENNPQLERYWNGSRWQNQTRAAQGAPAVELVTVQSSAPRAVAPAAQSRGTALRDTGNLLLGVAALTAVAAIALGLWLILDSSSTCVPNNTSSGVETCLAETVDYPFVTLGVTVMVGGLVQALVLLVLGQLARGLHDVREAVTAQ